MNAAKAKGGIFNSIFHTLVGFKVSFMTDHQVHLYALWPLKKKSRKSEMKMAHFHFFYEFLTN